MRGEGDPRAEKELGRASGMLGRASGALSEDAEERADWAECGIGLRGKGMEEKGWAASGFGGLTGLGLVSGFSPFPSLFFSNTLKLI